ncbi:hypothetical protein [uncultured Prevotella sp.]|uniref:hypothetical protein n=1 Tax=uncultured Prevotella sp. TaxID=159272 RepID=UPI0027E29A04|nr:hypothetical protein [uncultured Prevotella sp.]
MIRFSSTASTLTMFCSASVFGCAMPSSFGRCLMMASAVLFLISTMVCLSF